MGFQSVYKRHTPFALVEREIVLQGDTIRLENFGDVLVYMYLYTDASYIDWYNINTIDMIIGGQVVSTWDIKYITKFLPTLSAHTFSKSAYNDNFTFLPLPVPMLPLKNMRYHQCEFKINWKTPQNIRCIVTYAFIDEDIPDNDVLIQQMQRFQIRDSEPVKLTGLVKYLVSDTLSQPTKMNYQGSEFTVAPIEVYKYYHTGFGDTKYRNFTYSDVNIGMPRTSQRVGDTIFIFDSSNPYVYLYNTNSYFGSLTSYRKIVTPYESVWTSCTDGKVVYGCTLNGTFFQIDSNGVFSQPILTVPHEVYAIYFYEGSFYFVGVNIVSSFSGGVTSPFYLNSQYDGSFLIPHHPVYGNILMLFKIDGTSGVWVYNLDTGDRSVFNDPIEQFIIADKDTSLYNTYNQFSSSIQVNGVTYIASGYDNVFQVGENELHLVTGEQPYLTLVYDGNNYIYVYGQDRVFRYEINKYTLLVPYCLLTSSAESTGYINFNAIGEVRLRGCGNGTLYTVGYNFLRIQKGTAGLLYAY